MDPGFRRGDDLNYFLRVHQICQCKRTSTFMNTAYSKENMNLKRNPPRVSDRLNGLVRYLLWSVMIFNNLSVHEMIDADVSTESWLLECEGEKPACAFPRVSLGVMVFD